MSDTLRGINDDDWDNMDWADGIKPGEAVTVMGESGLNRVWSAPDLGFRPVMTGWPKGVYSKDSFGGCTIPRKKYNLNAKMYEM